MNQTELFGSAASTFADLVDHIPDDAWPGPGLGEWDLRALVGHASRSLITVDSYLDRPAEAEQVTSPEAYYLAVAEIVQASPEAVVERGRQAGLALGDDPGRTVRSLLVQVLDRVSRAGNPLMETIAGGMRLTAYLPTRTFELVVHAMDIATAAGLAQPQFAPEVLADVAVLAARIAVVRGDGPQLILALTGRTSLSGGYSVV